jgi:hypothetical protein
MDIAILWGELAFVCQAIARGLIEGIAAAVIIAQIILRIHIGYHAMHDIDLFRTVPFQQTAVIHYAVLGSAVLDDCCLNCALEIAVTHAPVLGHDIAVAVVLIQVAAFAVCLALGAPGVVIRNIRRAA